MSKLTRYGRFPLFSIYKTDNLDDAMSYQMALDHAYKLGYHEAMMEVFKQKKEYKGLYFLPSFVEVRSKYQRYLKHLEKIWKQEKWSW